MSETYSSTTEAITHLSYDSEPPSVFELTDDLLDPRIACGAPVRIRLAGNTVVRLQARLMLQRRLTAINNERNL